ncbi:MAG: MBOAT family protein [Lachnospiraceae bacterium]|nr:MBOAT family protein [Butyrivibrio sp.]MCM1342738.1 MBOAT family protein [Muribaculaceae bacterium]MCM1409998.1 MBOAT family protein [Lachnospiraceae bacterium]
MPIVIAGYFLLNRWSVTGGKVFLIAAGIFFYTYAGWRMSIVLGLSILGNYLAGRIIRKKSKYQKAALAVSVSANVALLLYLKYRDFFIENLNLAFHTAFDLKHIILPLGISFFTFQQIAYLADIYKGEAVDTGVVDYMLYILYFPKLLMGPITPFSDLTAQLNDPGSKKVDWDNITCGIKIFSFGLFKKMLLADTFSAAVAWGFENMDAATSMDLFLVMLFYTFEIYFDFSGYSDMAVGSSMMLNIRLPINFDSPYKALSIRDFWKRWHMSLTGFLTKYIYIPLGGSRKGRMRTGINTMIVFLVSGIWHGANWTFILWGAIHGIFCVAERFFEKYQKKCMKAVRWGITFLLVSLLWLLFRSDSIAEWLTMLGKMFSFQNMNISDGLIDVFNLPESALINDILHLGNIMAQVRGLWLLLFTVSASLICLIPENNYRRFRKNGYISMIFAAAAFVWAFLCLSSESVFVYFNF